MVLPALPARPISLLIVSRSSAEGNLLKMGLHESLSQYIKLLEITEDLQKGVDYFSSTHHDLVLVHGWTSSQSEAFVMRIRRNDGSRHTGIIVMAEPSEGFDRVVVENYNAGADEVVPYNLSLTILRSKLVMIFNYKVTTDMLRTANHKLQAMAVTDELTGCGNMRGFTKKFTTVMQDCAASKLGVAVMMMDLDHFKSVNDRFNHLVGSHVIKTTGQLLLNSKVIGPEDFAARYGGDEFVLLLLGQTFDEQKKKAQNICKLIEKHVFTFEKISLRITASIGVAWAPQGFSGSSSDVVKAADAALYRSKELGRNQVNCTEQIDRPSAPTLKKVG